MIKISESGTPVKSKNSTCFRQLPGDWRRQINVSWKFLNFLSLEEEKYVAKKVVVYKDELLFFLDQLSSQGTLFAANLKLYTNFVVRSLRSSSL